MGWLPEQIRRGLVRWLSHRLLPCDEVTRLASEGMDRELRFGERLGLRLHLLICRWCRRYSDQIHLLRDAAHGLPDHLEDLTSAPDDTLSPEARARIQRLLAG
jgi:hypothetical protein